LSKHGSVEILRLRQVSNAEHNVYISLNKNAGRDETQCMNTTGVYCATEK